MSGVKHMLTTIQELQMVDALVQLDKWPRKKAEYLNFAI
jgi:hypothetical protein